MTPLDVIMLDPHADQIVAYERMIENRYFALRCGRRWGKTNFLATLAVETAMSGRLFGMFAPDYRRMTETYVEIQKALKPILKSQGQFILRTINGGVVEFWTLNDKNAGRSRKYHMVGLDEVAFTTSDMMDTWKRSIKPTLLDYRGVAIAASNTCGIDESNFFYQITTDPQHEFVEYHAPSRNNPHLPADEIEHLRKMEHPLVFAQEYEAEWVDWSGDAFFSLDKLLVDGAPPPMPRRVDAVFAIMDTAVKTGSENDGSGVVYFGLNRLGDGHPLTILDWDLQQIEGDLLIDYLPSLFTRLEELAKLCNAMTGSIGVWIEDKQTGSTLIMAAQRRDLDVHAIDSALTAKGKDERAVGASGYYFRGDVKVCKEAFEKTLNYKRIERNHLIAQICGFRIGDKDAAKRADDLFDCAMYGPLIALGNSEGF